MTTSSSRACCFRSTISSTCLALLLGLALASHASAKTLKIATLMPEGSGFVAEMRAAGDRIADRTA